MNRVARYYRARVRRPRNETPADRAVRLGYFLSRDEILRREDENKSILVQEFDKYECRQAAGGRPVVLAYPDEGMAGRFCLVASVHRDDWAGVDFNHVVDIFHLTWLQIHTSEFTQNDWVAAPGPQSPQMRAQKLPFMLTIFVDRLRESLIELTAFRCYERINGYLIGHPVDGY